MPVRIIQNSEDEHNDAIVDHLVNATDTLVSGDLAVGGNLTISGTTTGINASEIAETTDRQFLSNATQTFTGSKTFANDVNLQGTLTGRSVNVIGTLNSPTYFRLFNPYGIKKAEIDSDTGDCLLNGQLNVDSIQAASGTQLSVNDDLSLTSGNEVIVNSPAGNNPTGFRANASTGERMEWRLTSNIRSDPNDPVKPQGDFNIVDTNNETTFYFRYNGGSRMSYNADGVNFFYDLIIRDHTVNADGSINRAGAKLVFQSEDGFLNNTEMYNDDTSNDFIVNCKAPTNQQHFRIDGQTQFKVLDGLVQCVPGDEELFRVENSSTDVGVTFPAHSSVQSTVTVEPNVKFKMNGSIYRSVHIVLSNSPYLTSVSGGAIYDIQPNDTFVVIASPTNIRVRLPTSLTPGREIIIKRDGTSGHGTVHIEPGNNGSLDHYTYPSTGYQLTVWFSATVIAGNTAGKWYIMDF